MTEPEISVSVEEAPAALETLVEQFCSLPVDFSDIPVIPEKLSQAEVDALKEAASLAYSGASYESVWRILEKSDSGSFEFDYARGKLMFAMGLYCEAAEWFNRAVVKFPGYGELWFLYGIANYQMGLFAEAFMEWYEAIRVNDNHQDARYVMNLAASMIKHSHTHLNPEAEAVLPIVSGRGIDVGCGSAKTHPSAIGVDIIAPGAKGDVASQKDRVSQADVEGSGDNLCMFKDGELDYVIARHNLEHYVDPLAALIEWRRVLKPGGLIGIVLPDDAEFDTIHADSTHMHVFTRQSLRRMVSLVEGLEVVAAGTSQNKWSFYTIIQKAGGARFDYHKALGQWLGHQVSARAAAASSMKKKTVAAAAYKKLRALNPASPFPADFEKLHPAPAWLGGSKTFDGKKTAVFGDSPFAEKLAKAFGADGKNAKTFPLGGDGKIGWQTEKALREYGAGSIVMTTFNPETAQGALDFGVPAVIWIDKPIVEESLLRLDFNLSGAAVITEIKREVEKFAAMGARKVFYQPHLAEAFEHESSGNNAAALVPAESERLYTAITERLKKALMAKNVSVENKNRLFAAIRRMGMIMDRLESGGIGDVDALRAAIAESALGEADIGAEEALYALAEEATARKTISLAKSLDIPIAQIAGNGAGFPDCAIAIITSPVTYADSAYPLVIDSMARGMAVVVNNMPGLAELFSNGTELCLTNSDAEALETVRRNIADGESRRRIAESGRKAVMEKLGASSAPGIILNATEREHNQR